MMLLIVLLVFAITTGGLVYMAPSEKVFKQQTTKRPVILTIICIIGILWSLFNFIVVFSPFVRKVSEWSPAIFGIIVAIQFISFIGIWNMKRWGVHLYIISFFAKQIFTILINDFGIMAAIGIVLSVIFMIFFFVFYRRMAEEL